MEFFSSIFGFVLAIGILVTVHEFGHFWVARTLGVKVLKFSVGFGRSLWSWRGKQDDTEYCIAMIPLGGYVKMLDETEGDVPDAELERAFNRKSLAVRSAVVIAGPLFNFLFAIFAYWAIFTIGIEGLRPVIGDLQPESVAEQAGLKPGDTVISIDGRRTQTWGEHRLYMMDRLLDGDPVEMVVERNGYGMVTANLSLDGSTTEALSPSGIEYALGMRPDLPELLAIVGTVVEGSPAGIAGLMPGDRIVEIERTPVNAWGDLVELVVPRAGQILQFSVERDGEMLEYHLTPEAVEANGRTVGRIGISPSAQTPGAEYFTTVDLGFVESFSRAVENTWLMSALTLKMLYRMLKLEVSVENLSGPITIAHYAGQSVQIGLIPFLTFLAIISVSLGVLNLLPIPVLDGGHLLYYAIELIRGGPLPDNVLYWGQQVGILMLAALMSLAFYNDILRLFN